MKTRVGSDLNQETVKLCVSGGVGGGEKLKRRENKKENIGAGHPNQGLSILSMNWIPRPILKF